MHMRILRLPEVLRLTGLSPSTLRRLERSGGFPAHKVLSRAAVGWLEAEVLDWIRTRATRVTETEGVSRG